MIALLMALLLPPAEAQLPLSLQPRHVRLAQFNWSSTYFPAFLGGLNRDGRGCARPADCWSPVKKLDRITGERFGFQSHVRRFNREADLLQKFWTGYCDGIATLQLSFPHLELRDTEYTVGGETFSLTPSDIVGLAALAIKLNRFESSGFEMIGERCGSPKLLPFRGRGCDDLDALAFHRALTEEVSAGRTYAVDLRPYGWIDNSVITGYDLGIEEISSTEARVTARVRSLKIGYARMADLTAPKTLTRRYVYLLRLDPSGVPVSGEWRSGQPDFLWRRRAHRFTEEFSFLNPLLNTTR